MAWFSLSATNKTKSISYVKPGAWTRHVNKKRKKFVSISWMRHENYAHGTLKFLRQEYREYITRRKHSFHNLKESRCILEMHKSLPQVKMCWFLWGFGDLLSSFFFPVWGGNVDDNRGAVCNEEATDKTPQKLKQQDISFAEARLRPQKSRMRGRRRLQGWSCSQNKEPENGERSASEYCFLKVSIARLQHNLI